MISSFIFPSFNFNLDFWRRDILLSDIWQSDTQQNDSEIKTK
jgi:hypothetical protein